MISLCKHSHIVLPPAGSIINPSDCTQCGLSYASREAELERQRIARINGSARDGECPYCGQYRRLYRYQVTEQPWHEIGTDLPATWLCGEDYRTAEEAENAFARSVITGAIPRISTAA